MPGIFKFTYPYWGEAHQERSMKGGTGAQLIYDTTESFNSRSSEIENENNCINDYERKVKTDINELKRMYSSVSFCIVINELHPSE